MPTRSKSKLKPLNLGNERIGERLAKIRKTKGLTQKDLAEIIGIMRTRVADYELGRIRLYDEMIIRFAIALGVKTDEILGLEVNKYNSDPINLSFIKKVKQIEKLPPGEKRALIKTIDKYIKS
ncbi:MAG: helix-turn-helix transcriptional regulator [Spirochaetes bacterium]|nr:helix-turn-helix transcriptional regulator [Spirochaetota bacterium]